MDSTQLSRSVLESLETSSCKMSALVESYVVIYPRQEGQQYATVSTTSVLLC